MRARWLSKTPELTPQPTEQEAAWWKANLGPIQRKAMLRFGVPFLVVQFIIFLLEPHASLGRTVFMATALTILSYLAALAMWATAERHYRAQHIRWKRVREELGVDEDRIQP